MSQVLEKLIAGTSLTELEASSAMDEIMGGRWTDVQISAFLIALRMKGETVPELVGFARVMREKARSLWESEEPIDVLDTCGTGGDHSGTFNISTAAAFVAAGAGAVVAKHGNRAASSRSGSADVLEALGVDISMESDKIRRAIREVGIGFLFAPEFHRSMRFVMPVRRELGIRTVFNILGPLSSPAAAAYQVIGVSSEALLEPMADAISRLGVLHAFVVHGHDGLDEVSPCGLTDVVEFVDGTLRRFVIEPDEAGIEPVPMSELMGGDAAVNARIVEGVLMGTPGPRLDAVLLNAGLAIMAAGLASSFREGVDIARDAVRSGRARSKLEALRAFSAI